MSIKYANIEMGEAKMYRVLLVDDERIMMQGLEHIIKEYDLGFNEFVMAESGEEALEIIETYKPHLVFSDVKMENINGLQLIEEIRKKGSWGRDLPIVIVSAYGEFEYAKKAIGHNIIDYILKPVDKQALYELLVKIKKIIDTRMVYDSSLKNYDSSVDVFSRIFKNQIKDSSELINLLNSIDITICGYTGFYLVRILKKVDCYNKLKIEKLISLLEGELIFKFNMGLGMICFMGLKENTSIDISGVFHSFEPMLVKEKTSMFFSDSFRELSGLSDAYKQLNLSTKYRKILKGRAVFTFSDTKSFSDKGPSFSREINDIVKGIEDSNMDLILKSFGEIYNFICASNHLSIVFIEKVYTEICMRLYSSFSYLQGIDQFSRIIEKLLKAGNEIDECDSYEDMHSKIKRIVLEFFSYYIKTDVKLFGSNFIIGKAKELIDKNFADSSITVNTMADKLQISSGYLSTLFKKEVGVSFRDYLKKVRIEHALEILKGKDVNISEIGEMIGYTGEKTFFSVFKQYTGVTPAKYKRKLSLL